jgi:hypothetical protein
VSDGAQTRIASIVLGLAGEDEREQQDATRELLELTGIEMEIEIEIEIEEKEREEREREKEKEKKSFCFSLDVQTIWKRCRRSWSTRI